MQALCGVAVGEVGENGGGVRAAFKGALKVLLAGLVVAALKSGHAKAHNSVVVVFIYHQRELKVLLGLGKL